MSSKIIDIKGKRNQDKISSIENPDFISERASIKKWDKKIIDEYETHIKQIEIVNRLYLDDMKFIHRDLFLKEINKKIDGYKRQDIDKSCYDENFFIDLETVLAKLTESKLKCHYCKTCCYLLYSEVLSRNQWTLDRIDNDYGHNKNNVVISCLDCNVRRKTMDFERFKMGKQLRFIKKE
jgi:hypothetical protein